MNRAEDPNVAAAIADERRQNEEAVEGILLCHRKNG